MKKCVVNYEALKLCIENWVDTFNDCACCPLYPISCKKEEMDTHDCAQRIIKELREVETGGVIPM